MPTWDKTTDPILPGLYLLLERAAERVIRPGERGIIAMVAESSIAEKRGAVHEVTTAKGIADTLGTNKAHAELALQGGASKLILYVKEDAEAIEDALEQLSPYYFDVFALGYDAVKADVDALKVWREQMKADGRHFVALAGNAWGLADDAAIELVYATAKHEDIVHVGLGVADASGDQYSGGQVAAYLAGLQGAKGLGEGSLTRAVIPFAVDVERRLTKAQREDFYTAGIAVPIHNGIDVVLEGAITSDATGFNKGKLRIAYNAAVYQETLTYAVESGFIGKINNDADGRAILLEAIAEFNDRLKQEGVLSQDTVTEIHPDFPPAGESIYLLTTGDFIDAAEKFFFEFVASGGAN
ncbi:phage tail sheath subtilisin-like domain-containing protein [Exiguobacterium sp. MMG028]|uniref:phage tail sheath subtilisin-like domain-containing protein n=1 Tax=Exiguobacterium sp. MMG028 TaxID=3021979 RepID=UPI0022FE8976|nr:phage tail sheath subtilisin-like domain-containing protein [Exiguobacterium sp. MMG028]MDA5561953.1 phage tail sheath subtilisin-like domain-containing protein [Exiguobacterium sp. MMG028]